MSQKNETELPEKDIQAKYPEAEALLKSFAYSPQIARVEVEAAPREMSPGVSAAPRTRFRSTTPGLISHRQAPSEGNVNLISRVMSVGNSTIPTPVPASVVQSLRRGLSIALAAGEQNSSRTGLTEMMRQNFEKSLPHERVAEFNSLLEAQSLVVLSVLANSVIALLSSQEGSEAVELGSVDEVITRSPAQALNGALWELDQKIAVHAADENRLVATVMGYMQRLSEKVRSRAETTPSASSFRHVSFKVEQDDIHISGFDVPRAKRGGALVMTFKKPEEVIGNAIAKHQSMRLAKMLMAYDFDRRLNPFAELGGFIFTFMGDGRPGTGKTTLIQMMAGLVNDYCSVAGYPFTYRNLSIENVDSYQGKSGQNAKAFIDGVMDPSSIGFGTVDDIDQVAGKRGDRQSSAGQQEITAVLMEAFAGANTVVRGNCTFGMFSNYPENVDDALRQRAGARFLVDGPITREDYIDILAVLMGKNHDIPVGKHELFVNQEIKRAVSAGYEKHNLPQEGGLISVWNDVQNRVGELDTLEKIGGYLKAIQQADDRFTGRAVKNITDAVKVRAMDFELPDEWMENPELFLWKGYDEKLAMISELRTPITARMLIQEINRYADSEFRYADKSDEEAVNRMVRDMGLQMKAKERFLNGRGE